MSLVHRAVIEDSSAKLNALLSTIPQSMIDQPDHFGQTAVCLAAARDDPTALAVLIKHGAKVNPQNNGDMCALVESVICGGKSCSSLLVRAGYDVNRIEAREVNALHASCIYGASRDAVEFLLHSGADIELPTKGGVTPIMLAAIGNQAEIGELLISFGAELGKVNMDGEHALHLAIKYNSHEILPVLLKANTDHHLRTRSSKSLLRYAAQYGDIRTLKILQRGRIWEIDTAACVKSLTASKWADRRQENSPEWLSTFQDLLERLKC